MQALKVTVFAATLVLSTVFAADNKNNEGDVKVAVFLPLGAGPSERAIGESFRALTTLAAAQINNQGGINGKKVTLVYKDDKCNPQASVIEATNVIKSGIKYAVGFFCSSTIIPLIETFNKQKIVSVVFGTVDSVTQKNNDYLFRLIPTNSEQISLIVDDIAAKHPKKKIAVVALDAFEQVSLIFQTEAQKNKLEVKLVERAIASETKFTNVINKMKASGIEVVYYIGYATDSGHFFDAIQKELPNVIKYASETLNEGTTTNTNIGFPTLPDYSATPENTELTKTLNEGRLYKTYYAYAGYTAIQLLATAMNNVQSEDTDKVKIVLHSRGFDTNIGTVSFERSGDVENINYVLSLKNKR